MLSINQLINLQKMLSINKLINLQKMLSINQLINLQKIAINKSANEFTKNCYQ
jgi:hypothetical protein